MTIMHWQPIRPRNPFGNLYSLQKRMNRMFDDMFTGEEADAPERDWSPRMDIVEVEGRLEIVVELPGVKKEDVKIELVDDVLTLSGQKAVPYEKQNRSLRLTERAYGAFRRSFQLPGQVNIEDVKAEFKDGVLKIVLDKREEAKPKQVEISVK